MKPTKEQCIEWAKESGCDRRVAGGWDDFIESLCHRVWDEAMDAAKKECEAETATWVSDQDDTNFFPTTASTNSR